MSAVDRLRMRPDRIRHSALEVLRRVDVPEVEVLLGLEQKLGQHTQQLRPVHLKPRLRLRHGRDPVDLLDQAELDADVARNLPS